MKTIITTEQQGNLSCHFVRAGCDWGRVLIDPAHNLVMCYTSCGNYNFSWHAPGEEFTGFLDRLGFDYAMSKFLGRPKELDLDGSVRNIRQHILEYRRSGDYTAEQARSMWKAVQEAEEGYSEEFTDAIRSGAIGSARHDWYELLRYFHGHQARHFWNLIWRPLMEQLTLVAA